MSFPKVIFFDAVGTLFGVRGSVGEIYGEMAQQFGVRADREALNQAFFRAFRQASPMAFPGVDAAEVPAHEFAWWRQIAFQSFQQVGAIAQFTDFSAFFTALYDHFKTADPWYVYPDTIATLTQWRDRGVQLGVLSNFDSRLYPVLSALGLADFFHSVTISTEVGAAKPNPLVFQSALEKHGCLPAAAWHVGDSYQEDYLGAKEAGLRAIWLKREEG